MRSCHSNVETVNILGNWEFYQKWSLRAFLLSPSLPQNSRLDRTQKYNKLQARNIYPGCEHIYRHHNFWVVKVFPVPVAIAISMARFPPALASEVAAIA